MTPYRTPAPHRHKYDRSKYVPPHNFVDVCTCGAVKPPPLWERVLGRVLDALFADERPRP